jgi:hypothetical protein
VDITLPFPLPALVDLVILGEPYGFQYEISQRDLATCYPILRRLYIEPTFVSGFPEFMNAIPITIKSLRVSNACWQSSLNHINSALRMPPPDSCPIAPSKPIFQRMIYQPNLTNELRELRLLVGRDERFVLLKQARYTLFLPWQASWVGRSPSDYTQRFSKAADEKRQWFETCAGKRDFWEPANERHGQMIS